MNTRDYKEFAPGEYYHVYNRGAGQIDIFKDDKDYYHFLRRLRLALGYKEKSFSVVKKPKFDGESVITRPLRISPLPTDAFSIISYCLMPNHFHFLICQNSKIPISQLISKVCTSYSMYFNRRHGRVGTLFQDVFKAVNVDRNAYLIWLTAYIHQNPAVAGLVWDLSQWKWSSFGEYIHINEGNALCEKDIVLEQFGAKNSYKKFVEESFDEIKKKKQASQIAFD